MNSGDLSHYITLLEPSQSTGYDADAEFVVAAKVQPKHIDEP